MSAEPWMRLPSDRRWRAVLALAMIGGGLAGCSGNDRRAEEIAGAIAAGRFEEANRVAEEWLARRPEDPEAVAWAARVALAKDRPDEAAELVHRVQELGLDRSRMLDIEGIIHARSGRLAEAQPPLLEHLASTDRPDPIAAEELAKIGVATFDFGLARQALARWRRDSPDDPEPWVIDADISWRVGEDVEQILGHYREALRRDPDHHPARLGLADTLRGASRHDEAAEAYALYLERNPDNPEALASAGLNELARGEFEAARALLDRAVALEPGHVKALKGLARIAQQAGRAEEALGHLKAAEEADPYDQEVAYQLSLVLARLGRAEEAERMRERSDRLRAESSRIGDWRDQLIRDPENLELHYEVARWLLDHGRTEEGIRWAEKALTVHPGDRAICLLLAEHYEGAERPDLANYYRWQAEPEGGDAKRP